LLKPTVLLLSSNTYPFTCKGSRIELLWWWWWW